MTAIYVLDVLVALAALGFLFNGAMSAVQILRARARRRRLYAIHEEHKAGFYRALAERRAELAAFRAAAPPREWHEDFGKGRAS